MSHPLHYSSFVSKTLASHLLAKASSAFDIPDLVHIGSIAGLETKDSLQFLVSLYNSLSPELSKVLDQRVKDRTFIDERVKACYELNQKLHIPINDPRYKTILGLEDSNGRIVIGPKSPQYCMKGGKAIPPIPKFLEGPHVTLFGPPDSAKMSINAMNAFHRKLPGEPKVVEKLLASQSTVPTWGADDEDSKTPLRKDLQDASVNLTGCFEHNIEFKDPDSNKSYKLASDHLSHPMKRFPGLALPCNFLFYKKNPIPLHLYDFALHLFRNYKNPKALVFYVPKLENEEEASYIHQMVETAEKMIQKMDSSYKLGTVRLMIVLENPRAILRVHEIIDALNPYFMGASLGWHDFLASTARLFREDGNYRIPVKADPNIVIKYIKASHTLVADVVGSRGGVKVGGMYGLLPKESDLKSASFQITLKGFFKDVVTQLKRDLNGFWVAHPDFVRLGLAIVEAWRQYKELPAAQKSQSEIFELTKDIFLENYRKEVDKFIASPDIVGLDKNDPSYVRSLIVADIKESDFIANNHPDEIRYNVFQSLQYLADWLSGNGCVALPTTVEGIPVRVMDDLATAERSRWEVWHEIRHGRFDLGDFIKIAHEEMLFIRKDLSNDKKIVQVKWDERTEKWYPVAFNIMLKLMTDFTPVEFASELLLPFAVEEIRDAAHPWEAMLKIDPKHFEVSSKVQKFNYYFEACGSHSFAEHMASLPFLDLPTCKNLILSFSKEEIIEAASFHGNIGETKKTLDANAKKEQAKAHLANDAELLELRTLGEEYLKKFGFKFLVSAFAKTSAELKTILESRIKNSASTELDNARLALWEITQKRIERHPLDSTHEALLKIAPNSTQPRTCSEFSESRREELKKRSLLPVNEHFSTTINAESENSGQVLSTYQIAVCDQLPGRIQSFTLGNMENQDAVFQIASLSKTFAAALALDFFDSLNIDISTPVAKILKDYKSPWTITKCDAGAEFDIEKVTLKDLMSHTAFNMHYVNGFPPTKKMPSALDLLMSNDQYGYEKIAVKNPPGSTFSYSGGGFIVLEHLLELLSKKSYQDLAKEFCAHLKLKSTFLDPSVISSDKKRAFGVDNSQQYLSSKFLNFPSCAAGGWSTARDVLTFLMHIDESYNKLTQTALKHSCSRQMLEKFDLGSRKFMGTQIGLGVFVAEADSNFLMIHQGANDGFRALYAYCYFGPDRGKGFVILSNSDNFGVEVIAKISQRLLKDLGFKGIDFKQYESKLFNQSGVSQEQIVNKGYKELVFDAFMPLLPEKITPSHRKLPLSAKNLLANASILDVSNQMFARAENLISSFEPEFDPTLFGAQGKIMDSWETVRHNAKGVDSLELKMPQASSIQYVYLSSKYHDGNQAPKVRLLGRAMASQSWSEFLDPVMMNGHSEIWIKLNHKTDQFSEIRVEMYPDGGLSRLGLYNELTKDEASAFKTSASAATTSSLSQRCVEEIPKSLKPLTINYTQDKEEIRKNFQSTPRHEIDFASLAFGGKVLRASNEHYSPAIQVISPYPPIHMFDGMESSRSRVPGHFEEIELELGEEISIGRIEFDFSYFINNNPVELSVEVWQRDEWRPLISKTRVKMFAGNKCEFIFSKANSLVGNKIRVRAYPDGGINRVHVFELGRRF